MTPTQNGETPALASNCMPATEQPWGCDGCLFTGYRSDFLHADCEFVEDPELVVRCPFCNSASVGPTGEDDAPLDIDLEAQQWNEELFVASLVAGTFALLGIIKLGVHMGWWS